MMLPFDIEYRPGGAYYIAYYDGGGHMADLPCRCLIEENRALAERAAAAEAEVAALKHDIERHIAIASSGAERAHKLEVALRRIAIDDDADCVHADDPQWMRRIAREATAP